MDRDRYRFWTWSELTAARVAAARVAAGHLPWTSGAVSLQRQLRRSPGSCRSALARALRKIPGYVRTYGYQYRTKHSGRKAG